MTKLEKRGMTSPVERAAFNGARVYAIMGTRRGRPVLVGVTQYPEKGERRIFLPPSLVGAMVDALKARRREVTMGPSSWAQTIRTDSSKKGVRTWRE